MKVVGLYGFKGSGKDTAAQALIDCGYTRLAFGDALKDTVASMFSWQRNLLEGDTSESRAWREEVDEWWSSRLGIPNFTPRFALTHLGSDIIRRYFHNDIWLLNLEKRLTYAGPKVVITDCRFRIEYHLLEKYNAKHVMIQRGSPPPFWVWSSVPETDSKFNECQRIMAGSGVHASEWEWNSFEFDTVISNDASIVDLHQRVLSSVR